jgi:chromosome partitioning protein
LRVCTHLNRTIPRPEVVVSKIISISNQKGGVGKTTTAVNLGASLAVAEKKVLVVDLDPQGNASSGVGITPNGATSYEFMLGAATPEEAIQSTLLGYMDLMPADRRLAGAEIELVGEGQREHFLKKALDPLRARYDYIIIDTPPSLGLLTLNALTAADSVLIPIQCEYYALEGLSQLLSTVQLVQRSLNPGLRLEGVLLTMYDRRLKLSNQVAEEAIDFFGQTVYETKIPRNVRLSEAPSFGKPILLYDVECVGAKSYLDLAGEVIAHNA